MKTIRFDIIDGHTGAVVASCSTHKGAIRSVDRRDNDYGAYRYRYSRIYETNPAED